MPINETDPWREQYFEGVPCPDNVVVPTDDGDAYNLYPAHRWLYNKLLIAESQGIQCAPHGLTPPELPVFSKPIYNMRGIRAGSRVIRSLEQWRRRQAPGHMWMEMPIDQRPDDGRSLVFDGEPLEAPLDILGAPELRLVFESNRPVAQVIVRLNDVFPDDTSARVSYGGLNLTHRESHEHPTPLEPGKRTEAVIQLNDIAHRFAAGNRVRVAISTAYWPIVWPTPERVTLGIHTGATGFVLPVRAPRAEDESLPAFPPPETGPESGGTVLRGSTLRRTIERDLLTGDVGYRIYDDGGEFDGAALIHLEDIDLEAGLALLQQYSIGESDPLSASGEIVAHALLRRGAWAPELRGRIELKATKDAFLVTAKVTANEGLSEVFSREWNEVIPRDLI